MRNIVIAGAALMALTGSAMAADMPLKAPAPVVVAGGFYAWIDGSYQYITMPSYMAGAHNVTTAPFNDLHSSTQQYRPHLDGEGIRGGLGYRMGLWTFEVGGSYVSADGRESGLSTPTGLYVAFPRLNGAFGDAFNCNNFTCAVAGQLTTDYTAWTINGKIGYDLRAGMFTITPSLEVFGGTSDTDQTLAQIFLQGPGGAVNSGRYNATTSLRSTDFGARLGLGIVANVSPNWVLDAKGSVGLANRETKLTGSDVGVFTLATFNGASSISSSDSTTPFLANAEVGVGYKFAPAWTARIFGGASYDSSVARVAAPGFAGNVVTPLSTTPARVAFDSSYNYYAGAGLKFGF